MVEVMTKTGMPLDEIMEFPMERFMMLYEATLRVDARIKTDMLYAMRVAQHGAPKDVTKLEDSWAERGGRKKRNDLKSFLSIVGKGF